MWPFKKKVKVLAKPVYRFRGGRLILSTLPAGRTEGQVAIWRQEVICAEIKYNGRPYMGLGMPIEGAGIDFFQEHKQ